MWDAQRESSDSSGELAGRMETRPLTGKFELYGIFDIHYLSKTSGGRFVGAVALG